MARDEERKKQQTERHVLTKAMVNHPIPRLFVSRRTDKSPNGFNCAVSRKDVSFLSRSPRGIWRHFKCKGHYLKDRRYRLDHEDVIYSENLDAIPVAEVSAELRAEIELTPPVTLGRMNKFVEDEVDALVGVPSNVPPTTLVGCLLELFELLRSGGSQVFMRRLWNQFRTTLPVETPYASVSWSKTETLVVIVQTLFPRVFRRVKSCPGDSPFSLALQSSLSGVKCVVRCCPDDSVLEICLVDVAFGGVSCETEIQCLARVLSLVPTRRGPVSIQGCPPVLFNAYVDWCQAVGRPVPIAAIVFDCDVLRLLMHDASFLCVGSVDPFATVEYLVHRLKRVRRHAWLLNLPRFRMCLESGAIPAASWCDVVQELLDNWSDIKICLSNDTLLMKKNVNVVDLDSLLCSDCLGLPRLALLHVVLMCFRSNCKKQFESSVRDYGCRNFSDFCFFYWSLLSKVKKVSQLPSIDNWSEYASKPLNSWANVTVAECLQGEPSILKALRGLDEALRRSFLSEYQGCLLELLKQLGSSPYAHSRIARSLSSLSVDMLLGGDADYVADLFQDLVACLPLVVELRGRSVDCSQIDDVFSFLESLDMFQCRARVRQVVRLVRVIVCPAPRPLPHVEISTSGCSVPLSVTQTGLSGVQSFVIQPKFVSTELLAVECIAELKSNLLVGHLFLGCSTVDPWSGVSRHPYEDVFGSIFRCYTAYYSG